MSHGDQASDLETDIDPDYPRVTVPPPRYAGRNGHADSGTAYALGRIDATLGLLGRQVRFVNANVIKNRRLTSAEYKLTKQAIADMRAQQTPRWTMAISSAALACIALMMAYERFWPK